MNILNKCKFKEACCNMINITFIYNIHHTWQPLRGRHLLGCAGMTPEGSVAADCVLSTKNDLQLTQKYNVMQSTQDFLVLQKIKFNGFKSCVNYL